MGTRLLFCFTVAGLAACGSDDGAAVVAWPQLPPDTLAFLLHLDGSTVIYGPYGPSGPEASLSLADAPSVIYAIERSSMMSVHPSVDGLRLEEAALVAPRADCAGCGACALDSGDRVLAPLPPFPSTQMWKRETGGDFSPLEGLSPPDDFVLSLPTFGGCEASVEPVVELELQLPSGVWERTLPVGDGRVWVRGSDLLLTHPDGTVHALSSQLDFTFVQDIKASGDHGYLAAITGPPRVIRVATSTAGIVLEQTWMLGDADASSVAPGPDGGFVAASVAPGELWVREGGSDPHRVQLAFGRGITDLILSPFESREYFAGAGGGVAIIIAPFDSPDSYQDAKISIADKQIIRFASRQAPTGPELWAVTNGVGLYLRDRTLHDANDWETPDAQLPPAPDGCAAAPECGFGGLNRDAVDVDVSGENVVARVENCEAIVLIKPDLHCATRLETPSGTPRGLSLELDRVWGLRGNKLLGLRLPD